MRQSGFYLRDILLFGVFSWRAFTVLDYQYINCILEGFQFFKMYFWIYLPLYPYACVFVSFGALTAFYFWWFEIKSLSVLYVFCIKAVLVKSAFKMDLTVFNKKIWNAPTVMSTPVYFQCVKCDTDQYKKF